MTVHRLPFLLIAFWALSINLKAQTLRAYQLYDSAGQAVEFEQLVAKAAEVDVFLFGELHNNPVDHWLQQELTLALLQKGHAVCLAAEMFESDNQEALNLYLEDSIDLEGLDSLARLWPNFKTDYLPLLNIAKDSALAFIASNIPRRYARMVYKQGFEALDSLEEAEKGWLPPLPIAYDPDLPGYRAMLEMMGGHGGENLPKAQAIKDATMAYFTLAQKPAEATVLHFNGDYHSKDFEGIIWYLQQAEPNLKIGSLSTVLQDKVTSLSAEYRGRADFILVIDAQMTTSY